ncbi:MAG: PKD domain-containing protein, partial [Candidatus Tenebribacter burtonii]|nr:PKD domain-containing protein [Candidatus Tenebribacter burtonii]
MKKIILSSILLLVAVILFATTIYDIQYTDVPGPDGTYPSPLDGDEVTVTGIITGANFGHDLYFFVSDPDGGAWHGVYVYDYIAGPSLGDEVEVTGTVAEYYGFTELGYCTVTILSSGNPVPDPIPVTTLDLVVPALAEAFEGCLVEVTNIEVTEAQGDFGEWYIDDGSGECQVDDGFFYLDEVVPPIVITVGMEWAIIRGCVDYSYDEFGLHPRTPDDLIESGLNANFYADPLIGSAPLQVQFTDASSVNITNWEWDFENDGVIDSCIQNPLHIYSVTGVYTVSLTISDGVEEDTEIKEDYITVIFDADFEADVTLGEAPLEVQFTDTSNGNITSWEWDFENDGTIDSNEQNPVFIYNEVGVYTVSLTVSDGINEDTEIKEDYVTVIFDADFEADVTLGEAPLEVQFTDTSNDNITSWEWDFENDGTIDSNEQNPIYIYNEVGVYTVSLTVSDGVNEDTEI